MIRLETFITAARAEAMNCPGTVNVLSQSPRLLLEKFLASLYAVVVICVKYVGLLCYLFKCRQRDLEGATQQVLTTANLNDLRNNSV